MGRSVAGTEGRGSGDVAPYAQEKGLPCVCMSWGIGACGSALTSLQGIHAGSQMPA